MFTTWAISLGSMVAYINSITHLNEGVNVQAKLDKMSRLINEFAEIEVVVKNGKIRLQHNWKEPGANESFNIFKKQVEGMFPEEQEKQAEGESKKAKPKKVQKKSSAKGGGKKTK